MYPLVSRVVPNCFSVGSTKHVLHFNLPCEVLYTLCGITTQNAGTPMQGMVNLICSGESTIHGRSGLSTPCFLLAGSCHTCGMLHAMFVSKIRTDRRFAGKSGATYLSTAGHQLLRQLPVGHLQEALEQHAHRHKELLTPHSEGKVGCAISQVVTPDCG